MLFRNLLFSGCLAGLFAGLFSGFLQQLMVSPIIYEAEIYEVDQSSIQQAHDHHGGSQNELWEPNNGLERIGHTYLASILIAISHGLILISLIMFAYYFFKKPFPSIRLGLIYGGLGYLVFYVMTSFGLPPELPGTIAADLLLRQIWWVISIFFSIIGLHMFYLISHRLIRYVGILVLIIPYLIGAPKPEIHGFFNQSSEAIRVLSSLTDDYLIVTAFFNLAYWLVLGILSTGFFCYLARR